MDNSTYENKTAVFKTLCGADQTRLKKKTLLSLCFSSARSFRACALGIGVQIVITTPINLSGPL